MADRKESTERIAVGVDGSDSSETVGEPPPVEVRAEVRCGTAVDVPAHAAHGASPPVVGSRGLGAF